MTASEDASEDASEGDITATAPDPHRAEADLGQGVADRRAVTPEEKARRPTIDEVLDAARSGLTRPVSIEDILAVQREGRSERSDTTRAC